MAPILDDRDARYGRLRDHFLRIGDTQFFVPPLAIQVNRMMRADRTNILRGKGSAMHQSGYFDLEITLSLFFPDAASINNELRPLIAQFKKCPFLPVENTLLNKVYKTEAVTISGLSVHTPEGFPYSLEATIKMYAFNPWSYIYDSGDRVYSELFNWPLFRWYYSRNLEPSPERFHTYYEPLQTELDEYYMFKIADEEDLVAIREWRRTKDRLLKEWKKDKSTLSFGEITGAAKLDPVTGFQWMDDESDEKRVLGILDDLYAKAKFEHDILMEEWLIPDFHLKSVDVMFENVISAQQLQGHESPVHQYLGSQDTMMVAKFVTNSEDALASFEDMVRRSTYLTRTYFKEVSNGFLQFDHPIARLFGVRFVVVADTQVNSVEGSPGLYEIQVTMLSYNRAQQKMHEVELMKGNASWNINWLEGTFLEGLYRATSPVEIMRKITNFSMDADYDVRKKAVYDSYVQDFFRFQQVYPDLELPTYKEVQDAGFTVPNWNEGVYVDPDFFILYDETMVFGDAVKEEVEKMYNVKLRDEAGGTGDMLLSKIMPGEQAKKEDEVAKEKLLHVKEVNISKGTAPDGSDASNLSTADMETLLRKRAKEKGVDQRMVVSFVQSFDPQLRQFYSEGYSQNRDLGNVTVADPNVPIMMDKGLQFFSDAGLVRQASYIGVMRVNPLMGDASGLGRSTEYNIEQGLSAFKYYQNRIVSQGQMSDHVYQAFGLNKNQQVEHNKAVWAGIMCMYLGFEREYEALYRTGKPLPQLLMVKIKNILSLYDKAREWSDQQVIERFKKLPIQDYKALAAPKEAKTPKTKTIQTEEDFLNEETTFQGMFHDLIEYDKRGRLVRAYPTFFLSFVDEGHYVGSVKLSDRYLRYQAISDITYMNSRKQAASQLQIEMSNVFGSLDDASKTQDLGHDSFGDMILSLIMPGAAASEIEDVRNRHENYFKSIYLRTGARIHFRMGYGSNPLKMPTVMNGTITALKNMGEKVVIVAQDDGIELTNKLKVAPDRTTDEGFLTAKQEPTEILDEILLDRLDPGDAFFNEKYEHSLGITHFGYKGDGYIGDLLVKYLWSTEDRPRYEINMNVYQTTGLLNVEHDEMWTQIFDFYGIGQADEDNINISLYDKTTWDVANVVAAIGPDMMVAVHPFDFRNTLFLGKPYFPIAYGYEVRDEAIVGLKYKPFRQYHVYDSLTSIIDNSIETTEQNMYTVAMGTYLDEGKLSMTPPVYADSNIWAEKQRVVQVDTQLNARGLEILDLLPVTIGTLGVSSLLNKGFKWYFDEGVALRITAAALRDFMKDMYDGYLTVLGDPSVKPYDHCLIHDDYMRMSGPIEVKEVIQVMSFESGYITMIKPDVVVVNSDKRVTGMLSQMMPVLTSVMITGAIRILLKNTNYKGSYPILNSAWALTKKMFNKTYGSTWNKFNSSKIGQKIGDYTETPRGYVKEKYQQISEKTIDKWIKSGKLKELVDQVGEGDATFYENLFKSWDGTLRDKQFLRYDKIDVDKMSKVSVKASKILAPTAKFAIRSGKALWGLGHLLAGPPGWIAFAIENLVMLLITTTIGEFLNRWLMTRQAVIIAPLSKDGSEYTAGINGHLGSVVGDSPDMWMKILGNPIIGGLLTALVGVDLDKYTNSPFQTTALQGATSNLSLEEGFFQAHRRRVHEDPSVLEKYHRNIEANAKYKDGRDQPKEDVNYNEIGDELHDLFSGLFDKVADWLGLDGKFGPGGTEAGIGEDWTMLDLNQPSGISATAINQAFQGKGLAGLGEAFVQLDGQVNALYLAAHAALETGWGSSRIFQDKNNLFGYQAYDNSPYDSAKGFPTPQSCIDFVSGKIKANYLTAGGKFYSKQYGPTLKGMNEKYASDKGWADKIASIMKKIAAFDPKFIPDPSATPHPGGMQTRGGVPDVLGAQGKKKYHLSSSQATQQLIDAKAQPDRLFDVTIVGGSSTSLLRPATYQMLNSFAGAYRRATGKKLVMTSGYRHQDNNWHGTGFGVDVDTPNAPTIGGKIRFPKGSREKKDVELMCEIAAQVGFGGIIHGDVDVIASMKQKYPNSQFIQMNDHYNHLHLSYPKG